MKKTFLSSLFFVLVLTLLVSCVSTVGVKSWVPSKIDLTGYKNIAVQSTKLSSYSFYNRYYTYIPVKAPDSSDITIAPEIYKIPSSFYKTTYSRVGDEATKIMIDAFDSAIYNVKDASWTDAAVNYSKTSSVGRTVRSTLLSNNIDLIVTSSLDDLFYEEYIQPRKEKDQDGNQYVSYYLYQRAYCQFSYTLQDVRSTNVLGSKIHKMEYPASSGFFGPEYAITLLGTAKMDGTGYVPTRFRWYSTPAQIFTDLLGDVAEDISKEVSPYQGRFSISLKKDPNKSEIMKTADKLVSDGQYKQALDIYEELYKEQGLFEAGYNRIVVTFAMGYRSDAETMAYQLWTSSHNENALNLYHKLKNLNEDQEKAINQIIGSEKKVSDNAELFGF